MILFVGDKPSKRTDPNVPFKGAACEKRLMEWIAEVTTSKYLLVNRVDDHFTGWITMSVVNSYPIIALGNNASQALDELGIWDHFKLPHPSGRNRQINDKAFISARLEACKEYLKNY